MTPDGFRIIGLLLACVFALFGCLQLIAAMRRGTRDMRACPKCEHPMPDSTMRCNECGFEATHNREVVGRSFPRRVQMLRAALLLVAAVFIIEWFPNSREAWRLIPDRLLVATLPWVNARGDGEGAWVELRDRLRFETLSETGESLVLDAVIRGDDNAPPGTQEWSRKYAPIVRALVPRLADNDDLQARLVEIQPVLDVRAPENWPAALPTTVLLRIERWSADDETLSISTQFNDEPPQHVQHNRRNRSRFPLAITLAPPGQHGLDGTLTVRVSGIEEPWRFPVHVAATTTLRDELQPVDTPSVTDFVRDTVFNSEFTMHARGAPRWGLRFRPSTPYGTDVPATLFGVEVTLRRNDQLARRSRIWWSPETRAGWETLEEHRAVLEADEPATDTWTLTVEGQFEIALRARLDHPSQAPHATHWWNGSFTRPIDVRVVDGDVAAREWEHEQLANEEQHEP